MFDVAVVGAGPSGAWSAFLLARAGARVALVDGSHPREKPCGGGLTGRALALVSAAMPPSGLPAVRIRAARFVDSEHDRSCDVSLDEAQTSTALLVADRRTFDALLVRAAGNAGVEMVPARVTKVSRETPGFSLATSRGSLRARTIIGADGANSLVRRLVAAPLPRSELSIAAGFYVHGVTSDQIVVELLSDPPGYIWSFPRPSHLAIGVCAQANAGVTSAPLRERAHRFILAQRLGLGAHLEPYAWPIPSLGVDYLRTLPLCGPDWLLVGDAAGLVDPITREGIYFALRSAEIAAGSIAGSDLGRYGRRVRSEILPELTRAARLKEGFFQPRFTGLILDALHESPAIRRVMADLVAGAQPYRGLKRRLLGTFEAGLAWRLVRARVHRGGLTATGSL